MSELKVILATPHPKMKNACDGAIEVYLKDEADKVIADLEEKLKNSRNARKYWMKEYLLEHKECIHHKYKRCLAMAYVEWLKQVIICFHPESILYRKAFKRGRKWKELAEKFKEAR